MRIAATLAGALVWALLMLPAAHADSGPQHPPVLEEQEAAEPDAGLLTGGSEARSEEESAQLLVKKRKKPQFQTRFFGE